MDHKETHMNTTIIGTGNMARGIGTRLVSGGHSVTLVSRDPKPASETLTALKAAAQKGATAQVAAWGSPLSGDVVFLAVPYSAVAEVAQQYKAQLSGKIVVDLTNPLNATYDGLTTPTGSSAAEAIAQALPGARVIKGFNTIFAGTLIKGVVGGQPLDVFLAGDDAEAKKVVSGLVQDGQLKAIDTGPLHRARQLEGLALLGITLQFTQGTQFASAWKFLV
jgi:8-hydroxy-5-deazaflavin:NADPH oxidoreductase